LSVGPNNQVVDAFGSNARATFSKRIDGTNDGIYVCFIDKISCGTKTSGKTHTHYSAKLLAFIGNRNIIRI
jgi:hypothetical protein